MQKIRYKVLLYIKLHIDQLNVAQTVTVVIRAV